jgi:hypothetical protein
LSFDWESLEMNLKVILIFLCYWMHWIPVVNVDGYSRDKRLQGIFYGMEYVEGTGKPLLCVTHKKFRQSPFYLIIGNQLIHGFDVIALFALLLTLFIIVKICLHKKTNTIERRPNHQKKPRQRKLRLFRRRPLRVRIRINMFSKLRM